MSILKSILALGLLVLLSQAIHASPRECRENLMFYSNRDSYQFSVANDAIDRDFGRDYLAQAIYAIRILLDKHRCSPKDINFGRGAHGTSHSKCSNIIANEDQTRVCYVETNLGYFLVSQDLLDTFNVIYSRWD